MVMRSVGARFIAPETRTQVAANSGRDETRPYEGINSGDNP